MPDFKRLLGAAAKALGDSSSSPSSSSSSAGGPGGSRPGSGTDWRDLVRTAADKLTGDERQQGAGGAGQAPGRAPGQQPRQSVPSAGQSAPQARASEADRVALGKYDYLLRTAEPEQLEQVHRDAFARLTPEQRELVQARLGEELPAHEQPRSGGTDDLARAATRGETAHPGLMQRVFGGGSGVGGAGAGTGTGTSGSGSRTGSGAGTFAAGAAAGVGVAALGGLALTVAAGAAVSSVAAPLLSGALADGVDFGGLAENFGLEGIAGLGEGLGGLTEGVDGLAQAGEEGLTGLGEQVGGLGEGFQIPGLGDLFDR
ncbi:Spy/CpxP family protein refolding chaperone [Frigoribacterium sp. PvP120]|uniref:cation-transporting ATPase n=1 Tax=unclassified Frigoribacterium TaxID=2627005 RepID=UPI001AE6DEBA|nr:cation-transporting ATPase [Frigoribacterium sp. PvP121]MBP1240668.1 Spy/CpxP family protein refolding chaperone [Frigoribacterium sp. PvP121]